MQPKLVVAISSRALFDLDESNQIFEKEGIGAYTEYQRSHEQTALEPGPAFCLVEKFLQLNEGRDKEDALVEVLLLSRNTADSGLRIFNSIEHHNLEITRAAFAGGHSPYGYAKAFGAHLFLSLNPDDVKQALNLGLASAMIWSDTRHGSEHKNSLNIAFDGDSVLFSDEAEIIYKQSGLDAFNHAEKQSAHKPLQGGPFRSFIQALQGLQSVENLPIELRTALVTARSAPAHERVIHTLRSWEIRIDESLFLGGLPKVEFLKAFNADIFFDDHQHHCKLASSKVTAAHVPYGIANKTNQ